jgi:outer membrane receptor protein involved in Fe transport
MKGLYGLLLSLFAVSALAQTEATVSGRMVDARTQMPLPFASVTVSSRATGAAVTGVLTDDDGRFVVAGLPEGQYVFNLEFLGYRPIDTTVLVTARNPIYDLGAFDLQPNVEDIEEVVATAQRQIVEATLDRRVYNMEDNIAGSMGSVLDAMRGLPGVTVGQDGQVLLRGSDRVAVLIDGKYSSLTGFGNQAGLDSIPAGNIASIEIINNPSAAYDAAGMAGIINIVYRQDVERGLNYEAGLALATGALSKRRSDLPSELGSYSGNVKLIPSFDISYNEDDRRYFLQSEFLIQDDLPNNEFTSRFYDDGHVILSQVPENREQEQYIISAGLDRTLDERRSYSLSAILDFETHTDRAQVPFIDAATMQRNRYWFWREKEDTGYFNVNFDYSLAFDEPGHTLSFSGQYTRGWEDEAYFLNEESPVRVGTDMTHVDATEHVLPFQIDYVRPLATGRFETGARLQKRWIPVTYTVDRGVDSVIYQGLGDWSEWGEDIFAGYVNYVHERERYAVEAGVRAEQTDVYYDLPPENTYYDQSDSYDYFELYPNVRLTYKIDDSNSFAVYYNNRVDRPAEAELRIFPKYDDPELLKVGNPYLRPQFTETVEVSYEHLWDTGSAIASVYYRDIDDPFTRVFAIDPTNTTYDIVNRIYQNVGSGNQTGLELILSQDISSRWEVSGSVNWYDNVIDADVVTLLFPVERPFLVERSADNTWDMSLNSVFSFSNGARAQLSFVYYAAKNIAQGTQDARSSIDVGFTKPVFGDRGELVFSVTDLLNEFGIKQNIRGAGFDAIYENYYETQVVSFGLNYEF